MEVFPNTVLQEVGFNQKISSIWRTIISDMESGREERQKKWTFPKRRLNLPWELVNETVIKDLWSFHQARSGAYDPFWFYMRMAAHWYKEYVGRGTGAALTFDMPSKNTTNDASLIIYVDNVVTAATFVAGGGDGGSDRITFGAAPGLGALITASFYGYLRLRARFAVDNLDYEYFVYMLYNFGLEILEVKP